MYTLYKSYGVNVGTLFLTGFLTSAVFGTFLGIYVDSWGRKLGCVIFCVLEIVINLLEHVPSMPVLLVGRVLGGLSTSLLFTAFESWMVSEHRKRKFDERLLSGTFSIASWGNGFVAIGAGFLAQMSADISGDIGPFQVAILLTIVCLVLILFWPENYGSVGDSIERCDYHSSHF
jgi:MFS family permease